MRVIPKALASLTAPSLLLLASCASSGPPAGLANRAVAPGAAPAPSARLAAYSPEAAVPASLLDPVGPQDRYGDRDSRSRARSDRSRGDYDSTRGQYSPPPTGRFSIHLGGRSVDDAFEPTDSPGVLGFEFSQVPDLGGLGFEFGLGFAADQEDNVNVPGVGIADLDLTQAEISAGARAEFGQGALRPYIGGGGVFLSTRTTLEQGFLEAEEDDTVFGGYFHGGIQGDLNETVFIGIDYRRVFAGDYDINGVDIPADYDQITFVVGFNL